MKYVSGLLLWLWLMSGMAQTPVVVIPMSGDDLQPLANIVTVALANGDFDDPVAAVNSIPDIGPEAPSATNPYLVVIAPGVYELDETLQMRDYVSIAGSGSKATILSGSIGTPADNSTSALVLAAGDARLSDLRIQNQAGGRGEEIAIGLFTDPDATNFLVQDVEIFVSGAFDLNIAMSNGFSGVTIRNVSLTAEGEIGSSSENIAMRNSSAPVTVEGLTAVARGGQEATGILNSFAAIELRNALVRVDSATDSNIGIRNEEQFEIDMQDMTINVSSGGQNDALSYGVFNDNSGPRINNTKISVFGTDESYGVFSTDSSEPILTEVNINMRSGDPAHGVYVESGTTRLRRCSMNGDDSSVTALEGATVVISNSMVADGNTGGGGTILCYQSASDEGSLGELNTSCDFPGP